MGVVAAAVVQEGTADSEREGQKNTLAEYEGGGSWKIDDFGVGRLEYGGLVD